MSLRKRVCGGMLALVFAIAVVVSALSLRYDPEGTRHCVLHDAFLWSSGDGGVRYLAGPVEAAVEADGTVLVGAERVGRVDLAHGPDPGRGLMLYVAERAALRDLNEHGRVWGYLLPGARVAVRSTDGGYLVAPGPPFGNRRFFVEAGLLTSAKVAAERQLPRAGASVARCGPIRWARAGDLSTVGFTDHCFEVSIGPEPGRVMQVVDGIELEGVSHPVDIAACLRHGPQSGTAYGVNVAEPCRATVAVVRGGRSWRLGASPPRAEDLGALTEAGLVGVQRGVGDHLWEHLSAGRPVHLLVKEEGAPKCQAWALDGGYLGRLPDSQSGERLLVGRRLRYLKGDGHNLPRLELEAVSYVVVWSDDVEAHLVGRSMPRDALAYDPAEAERWFFDSIACEEARARAEEVGAEAPWRWLELGFHAPAFERERAW